MRLAIIYILSLSLLTLGTACSKKHRSDAQTLSDSQIQDLVTRSGKDYVVLSFYSTDCKPCVKEIPELIDFQQETIENVDVYLLSLDRKDIKAEQLAAFLGNFDRSAPIYRCEKNDMKTFFNKYRLKWEGEYPPLTMIFEGNGRLVEVLGITDANEIDMIIHKDQSFPN